MAVRRAAPGLAQIPNVELIEAGAALNAIHLFAEVDAVILVDAVRTSGPTPRPGRLVRAEVGPAGLPGSMRSSLSSHGVGVGEAIALAAAVGDVPTVLVLGVEVGATTGGEGMSPPVEAALEALVARIVTEAERLSSP